MPLSKIQAESMNLADTYAFSGTVSGVGGLVKISTTTASNATSVSFTGLDTTSTYSMYKIVLDNVTAQSDNTAVLYARYGIGSTPTYNSSSNYNSVFYSGGSTTIGNTYQNNHGLAQLWLAGLTGDGYRIPGDTFEFLSGTMDLFRMGDSNHPPQTNWIIGYPMSGVIQACAFGTGTFSESSEIVNGTAIQFFMSSGNINGTFTLYGVKS
jgi:hypothetical protein